MGYRYEVWGGGYNWLQSNEVSADDVWTLVKKVLSHYQEKLNERKQVIIISHSMGGVVTRSLCAKRKEKSILGVIHLAQPAAGAPAVYKRMRAGYEGVLQIVLGRNAADVTGILGKAQGGLELLPFAHYDKGQPWLSCPRDTGKNSPFLHLPKGGDPYTDIYKATGWYALLPDYNLKYILLNDKATREELADCREQFSKMIDKVEKFHKSIINYHPNTYAVWAEDEDMEAWRSIYWKSREEVRHSRDNMPRPYDVHVPALWDGGNGRISHGNFNYFLQMTNSPGDETVPDVSARDQQSAAKVSFIHGNRSNPDNKHGWEHQYCCLDDRVQWATVYSILKMVSATKP